ncbi:MAG TPA: pilus assembly protein PilM [Vicinamibacterales bacterium]|jgi:type IV pilus assembly protein PilM|nr:pilus assembly protein PilM [Vicinamibacterales bacterium]
MSIFTSWLASPPPDAALELAPDSVSGAVVSARGADATVQSFAFEPLPAGALVPSLTGQNLVDRAAVVAAIKAVIDRIGRPKKVALVVPDLATRVSLVRFEQVPASREDLDQLIRWQVKKSAPFPIEEASLTWTPGSQAIDGGHEFVVALARQDVIREYESACESAGLHAGLVDLSTFSVVNCYLAGGRVPTGDWLVVQVRSDYTSIAIMRGGDVIFFRNRGEGEGDALADLVHQTTMYYQDRLSGQGFTRVLVGGTGRPGGDLEMARRGLEERLGVPVETIDPTRVATLTDRITVSRDVMARLAPLVGMMLRTRQETAAA